MNCLKKYCIFFPFLVAFGLPLFSQNVNYQVYDRQYYTGIGNTDFWTDDDPSWFLLVFDNTDGYASGFGLFRGIDDGLDGAAWYNPSDLNLRTQNNTAATGIKIRLEAWEDDGCGADQTYNTGCANDDDNHCGPSLSGVISFKADPACQWNNYQYDCSGNWKAQYKIYWDWAAAPTITSQPTPDDRNVCSPSTTTLTVVANAAARFYQWQINTATGTPQGGCSVGGWTNIGGATAASYIVSFTAGTRLYRCLITSNCTADFTSLTTTSNCVRVNGFPFAPPVQSPVCGGTTGIGSIQNFSVAIPPAAGAIANASYSWVSIPAGPTIATPTASSTNITFPASGTFTIQVTVDDNGGPCGTTTSSCIVTVNAPNCDFVYTNPATANTSGGSSNSPVTLTAAIGLTSATRNHIRMEEGTYTQTSIINIPSNVIIEGGYRNTAGNWTKRSDAVTTINFTNAANETIDANTAHVAGFKSNSVTGWTLQDLTITTAAVTGTSASGRGKSNYAVWTTGSSGYNIIRCTITSGAATNGAAGSGLGGAGAGGPVGNNGWNGSCDGGNGGGGAAVTGPGAGIRKGGNGGAGGAGGPEGYTVGSGGSVGTNGGGGALKDPTAGGGGGRASCDGGNGGSASASIATSQATIGAAGGGGAAGPAYSLAGSYFLPGAQAGNGSDGGGGGGGAGGGGGGGQGENCCWCVCNDGGGNGGGGGGAGGQGGQGGAGAWGGGGSFALWVNGTTGTYTNIVFTAGALGTGGTGQSGGGGGAGGNGGSGATNCTSEVGAGGNGSKGASGGAGGAGGNGANGTSAVYVAAGAVQANPSTSVPNPANALIVNYNNNSGCTNSYISLSKGALSGIWSSYGAGGVIVKDITSALSSFNTASNPVSAYYTSTGWKDITTITDTRARLLYVKTTRTLPAIGALSSPICKDGNINLSCTPNNPYNNSNFEWTIQATPVTGLSTPIPVYTSSVEDPGLVSLANASGSDIVYQVKLRVQDQCCGWSIPVFTTVTVRPELLAGSIGNPHTICYSGDPSALTNVSGASGGGGIFTYEWEYQDDCAGVWTVIASSNSTTYDPPSGLISTRCYRRKVTNDCGNIIYSNTITVTVLPVFDPGTVSGGEGLCSGDNPNPIIAIPSGGSGSYSYQWQSKPGSTCDLVGWTDIPGATSATYDPPAGIVSTTIFRCRVDDVGTPDCGAITPSTNCITITVTPTGTWTGIISTDWFTAGNWCGGVPTSATDATIPGGVNNFPVIGAAGAVCKSLIIGSNASLTISTPDNLNIYGNWTNDGTFSNGTGSVSFVAGIAQSINGATSTAFNNLTVFNTSATGLTLNSPAIVTGTLTLTDGFIYTTTINVLTLTNTASSSPGSSSSYLQGPIIKQGSTDFIFPVGKGTKWARIGIFGITASSDFRAEYVNTPYTDITTVTSPLQVVSGLEHWILDKVAGAGNAEVRIYWEDAAWSDILNCTTNGDLVVAHWTAGTWNDRGSPTVTAGCTGSAPFTGWIQSNSVATFSPFTFGSKSWQANPLPVTLLDFNAECFFSESNKYEIEMNWTTVSEINNDYFNIERSNDGINFLSVGAVKGKGNSNSIVNYHFIDTPDPEINGPESIYYYRLRQQDFDGTTEISEIVATSCNLIVNSNLNVYPNPAKNKVFIAIHSEETTHNGNLFISDVLGKKHLSQKVAVKKGKNIFELNTKNVASGSYFINLQFENGKPLIQKLSIE